MTDKVTTRFAPSPTGFLHIGGARTALFNWLYAKANGGTMRLRIEDTDRARSTEEAIEAILDGLRWLGLDWDDETVFQHSRADRHREVAEQLLASGHAYRCYCTPEELAVMREKAREEGRPAGYDGTWRDRDPAEAPDGVAPAIRFKAPRDGETTVEDHVQGAVTIPNSQLDDLIILRSDGTPTYMLSVVVDDHDMGVTHVIRGDDHLTNAAKQLQIYLALGWDVPEFAHIPLIHGPDGAKLSKRHGALGVEAYRAMGYVPAAMRNYLARLGWSHGDDEIFSTEQVVEWFGLDAIGRAPARFDFAKLDHLNAYYIRSMPAGELTDLLVDSLPYLDCEFDKAPLLGPGAAEKLATAVPYLQEKAKSLVDLAGSALFLFDKRPLALNAKASDILAGGGREIITELLPRLSAVTDWSTDVLEAEVREFVEESGLKLGKVAQPLRAALTGGRASPGIYEVLEVLGREEAIARLEDQAL